MLNVEKLQSLHKRAVADVASGMESISSDVDFHARPEAIPAEYLERMKLMSREEFLDAFLEWNGIIGYTGTILHCIDSIEQSEVK